MGTFPMDDSADDLIMIILRADLGTLISDGVDAKLTAKLWDALGEDSLDSLLEEALSEG